MSEITRILLENEMDLILAHKQSMRLAELSGLALPAQTTFATAVSEIARLAIDQANESSLFLSVSDKKDRVKEITATITNGKKNFISAKSEGYKYARRLVDDIAITQQDDKTKVTLSFHLANTFRIDDTMIENWIILFNTDPSVSPYEEIKRKNRQLTELSEKLKESEGQYRTLTNSLPLMIFTLNTAGEVTYANKWLKEYTGQTLETLNETHWSNVLHPEDANNRWDNLEESGGNNPITVELRLKDNRDNEYKWYTGIITPIFDDKGALQYWTAYLADIQAQKTIEEALKDNKILKDTQSKLEDKIAELNQSNLELEQFAYIASHDLQEPLRKISFYSDYLQNNKTQVLAGDNRIFIENISNATDRMKQLIHDILAYSTINRKTKDFLPTNLNTVVDEAVHDLEIAIKERNAIITIDKLPVIDGNGNQLKQLFENIISNAIKYTAADIVPEVHLSATIDSNTASVYIKDNGIGFEEKYLDKMFTIFQRLHNRDKYNGTGIGLSICKRIVEIHSGLITASSKPGQGSTFIVTLPLKQII